MRLLWSLPKAAPALLRHAAAYADLASLDLARARREIAAELLASAIAAISSLFAVFMGCLAVVAYTWDTPHRVSAIVWMAGGFAGIAIVATAYRASAVRAKSPLFSFVRRQWQEDRVLLERLLSADQE
ncbi:MAG TPA: hypothetical protein VGN30_21200 [Steroidobacteraceae bacterium]